jgi:hypothetical protein
MRILMLTAFDRQYFELGLGAIQSIRDKPQGANAELVVLNLGLAADQIDFLQTVATLVVEPQWSFDFPGKSTAPGYLKGLLTRPFLKQYFPGYDVYVWLDADAWVQDWLAIDLLVQGAMRRQGMAVSVELHRASMQQYGQLPHFRQWVHANYLRMFNSDIATALDTFPMINAGVFAIHSQAPHWDLWRQAIQHVLLREASIMTDQFALNFIVYTQNLMNRTELVPEWCNWILNGLPAWDAHRCILTEPYLPLHSIGILHLAGNKLEEMELSTTSGGKVTVPLRYPKYRAFVDRESKAGRSAAR